MSNITEILEGVDNVKVSIVMQVNLQDYKGSRTDSIGKFHRAVESFKNQLYKNTELIIVSDNCVKTQQLYNRSYKNDENIKFVYYDRNPNEPEMYSTREGDSPDLRYTRGFARRLGVAAATGKITTYMDSDDYLAPEFAMTIMLIYNQSPDNDWWINTSWYDNVRAEYEDSDIMYASSESETVELPYIHDKWQATKLKPGMIVMSPWLITHRTESTVEWRDAYGTVSEDVDFNRRLRAKYPNGGSYARPIYVRCHYTNKWDV